MGSQQNRTLPHSQESDPQSGETAWELEGGFESYVLLQMHMEQLSSRTTRSLITTDNGSGQTELKRSYQWPTSV